MAITSTTADSDYQSKKVTFHELVRVSYTWHPDDYDRKSIQTDPLIYDDIVDFVTWRKMMQRECFMEQMDRVSSSTATADRNSETHDHGNDQQEVSPLRSITANKNAMRSNDSHQNQLLNSSMKHLPLKNIWNKNMNSQQQLGMYNPSTFSHSSYHHHHQQQRPYFHHHDNHIPHHYQFITHPYHQYNKMEWNGWSNQPLPQPNHNRHPARPHPAHNHVTSPFNVSDSYFTLENTFPSLNQHCHQQVPSPSEQNKDLFGHSSSVNHSEQQDPFHLNINSDISASNNVFHYQHQATIHTPTLVSNVSSS